MWWSLILSHYHANHAGYNKWSFCLLNDLRDIVSKQMKRGILIKSREYTWGERERVCIKCHVAIRENKLFKMKQHNHAKWSGETVNDRPPSNNLCQDIHHDSVLTTVYMRKSVTLHVKLHQLQISSLVNSFNGNKKEIKNVERICLKKFVRSGQLNSWYWFYLSMNKTWFTAPLLV